MPEGGRGAGPLLGEEGGEDTSLEVRWWLGWWSRGAGGTKEVLEGGFQRKSWKYKRQVVGRLGFLKWTFRR